MSTAITTTITPEHYLDPTDPYCFIANGENRVQPSPETISYNMLSDLITEVFYNAFPNSINLPKPVSEIVRSYYLPQSLDLFLRASKNKISEQIHNMQVLGTSFSKLSFDKVGNLSYSIHTIKNVDFSSCPKVSSIHLMELRLILPLVVFELKFPDITITDEQYKEINDLDNTIMEDPFIKDLNRNMIEFKMTLVLLIDDPNCKLEMEDILTEFSLNYPVEADAILMYLYIQFKKILMESGKTQVSDYKELKEFLLLNIRPLIADDAFDELLSIVLQYYLLTMVLPGYMNKMIQLEGWCYIGRLTWAYFAKTADEEKKFKANDANELREINLELQRRMKRVAEYTDRHKS